MKKSMIQNIDSQSDPHMMHAELEKKIITVEALGNSWVWHKEAGDQHIKTLCQGLSRAGLNHQTISECIHKVWTNQKSDILGLSL